MRNWIEVIASCGAKNKDLERLIEKKEREKPEEPVDPKEAEYIRYEKAEQKQSLQERAYWKEE